MHVRATVGFGFTSDEMKKWRKKKSEEMQNQSNSLILSTLNWKPLYPMDSYLYGG